VEREVLAGAGGGLAVSGATVSRWERRGDAGDRHCGARPGGVQCGVPEVTDEAGEDGGAQAECGGGALQRRSQRAIGAIMRRAGTTTNTTVAASPPGICAGGARCEYTADVRPLICGPPLVDHAGLQRGFHGGSPRRILASHTIASARVRKPGAWTRPHRRVSQEGARACENSGAPPSRCSSP
jgi:hypothetical protein